MIHKTPLLTVILFLLPLTLAGCQPADSRDYAARRQLIEVRQALAAYRQDTGSYPAEIGFLVSLAPGASVPGWKGPYLTADRLNDPWRHPIHYGEVGGLVFVGSTGPNGRPETGGEDLQQGINRGDDIVLILPKETP